MSFVEFFIFFGSMFALVLAIGQFIVVRPNLGNYIMAAFLASVSIWLGYHGLMVTNQLHKYPHLFMLHVPFIYASGPLMYFYFQLLGKKKHLWSKRDLLHFVPVFLLVLLLLPFYLRSASEKLFLLENPPTLAQHNIFLSVYMIVIFFIMTILLGYIFSYLRDTSFIWNRKYIRLNKIAYFSHAIIILILSVALLYFLGLIAVNIFHLSRVMYLNIIKAVSIGATLVLIAIYFMGKRFPYYFEELFERAKNNRYDSSKIEKLDVPKILSDLENLFIKEQLFLNEELTLKALAEELGIASYQLSQILNERLGKNFNTFVNEYRIEEAKRILRENPELTISYAAYQVGFSSQSSFYDWFLKLTGVSPKKYKEQLKIINE